MSTEVETKLNNKTENNPDPQKKNKIARWIVGGSFLLCAFAKFFSFSSLFFVISALLMIPIEALEQYLLKWKIKQKIAIILSVVIFCLGSLLVPAGEPTADDNNDQGTIGENFDDNDMIPETNISNNSNSNDIVEPDKSESNDNAVIPDKTDTDKDNDTIKPDDTSNNEEKVQMVWISSSGSKYHSKSNCSGMKTPRQITLEEAQKQGYEPCKKCY